MNQKQIAELEEVRRATKKVATANRTLAILLLVKDAAMSLSLYSVDHARRLKYAYLKDGVAALEDKRVNNRERVLTHTERNEIVAILQTKQPKDVIEGCNEEYWSTYRLGEYIHDHTGKRYRSKTSEYLLFKEAKLTFHLPGKSYEKADPIRTADWKKKQMHGHSKLMRAWRDESTVIFCEDEMVLTSATTTQKIWLPRGDYPPIVETNGTKKRQSFYGFYNLKDGSQTAFVTDRQNMYVTVEVLNKLRKLYPANKLLILWDNCGWHRGSKVTDWIKQDGNTDTLHFPPYTPDLNPQEHVWKAGRKAVSHNQYISNVKETAEQFRQHIASRTFDYELCGLRPKTIVD